MRAAIDVALSSDNAVRVTKAKYSELLQGYPEKLRKQILTAFDEPFNRITAKEKTAPPECTEQSTICSVASKGAIPSAKTLQRSDTFAPCCMCRFRLLPRSVLSGVH
jgi:hypothetical protein